MTTYPLDPAIDGPYPLDPADCIHNWLQPANHDDEGRPLADPAAVSVCGSCGAQFDSMNSRL